MAERDVPAVTSPGRCPSRFPACSRKAWTTRSYLQENPFLARGYNYVLGELNRDGRWYAFPLMVLLKTPLAVFALALLGPALTRAARSAARCLPCRSWW